MYQVAENLLPVRQGALLPLHLIHRHQEDTMAQEGHVINGHVPKIIRHQKHFNHSLIGVK